MRIDTLIDEGVDVVKEIKRQSSALRKRAERNFPSKGGESSTERTLREYGFYSYEGTPNALELRRCIEVNGCDVEINPHLFSELQVLYGIDDSHLRGLLRPYIKEARLESLSNYVLELEPHEIIYTNLRDRFKHLIDKNIGGMDKFRELFNVDERIPRYSRDGKMERFIALGLEFEDMVGKYVFPNAFKQVEIDNCRPDFVIGDRWIDVKLSRTTAFDYRDNTIDKYLQRTDDLLIVYALDNDSPAPSGIPNGVELAHISEFYEGLPPEVISEFEDFLTRAYGFKEAI